MVARSLEQLERQIMDEMKKAMNIISDKALSDMYDEVGDFYTGGDPIMYKRTGALGDTPRTTNLSVSKSSISFDAYLDTTHRYTSGKNPTMLDVLNLTDQGITNSSVGNLRRAVGKRGFWERAEKKIEKSFNETMQSFFH